MIKTFVHQRSRSRTHVIFVLSCALLLAGILASCSAQRSDESGATVAERPTPTASVKPSPTPLPTNTPTSSVAGQATSAQNVAQPPISPTPTPDSPPVRLVIPALGIDAPVVEMGWRIVGRGKNRRSEWVIPDYAAGHHINSANPGQAGNVVISGHHNIKGRVFEQISRDIDRKEPRLKPGSEIQLYAADGREYIYRVEQVLLLREVGASEEERRQNAQWMAPTDEPVLTLITCWPFWTNTHRVIVRARLDTSDATAAAH